MMMKTAGTKGERFTAIITINITSFSIYVY